MNLDADYVRGILRYNKRTGVLHWKKRADATACWNAQFSGKIAGSIGSTGYVRVSINDRGFLAHRLIWLIVTGEWPKEEIDHKDQNEANNRWANLREASRQQNQRNRRRHKSNTSGFKGVFKNRIGSTWSAQIYLKRNKIHVGCYPTAEAAHAGYREAARQHYGEFARLS